MSHQNESIRNERLYFIVLTTGDQFLGNHSEKLVTVTSNYKASVLFKNGMYCIFIFHSSLL